VPAAVQHHLAEGEVVVEVDTSPGQARCCRAATRHRRELERPALEVLDGNGVEVDAFEAADVDGGHPIALRVHAFGVRMNAAGSRRSDAG
jgi:hypothetical protein